MCKTSTNQMADICISDCKDRNCVKVVKSIADYQLSELENLSIATSCA